MLVLSFCKPVIHQWKILGGGKLEYYKSIGGPQNEGNQILKFQWQVGWAQFFTQNYWGKRFWRKLCILNISIRQEMHSMQFIMIGRSFPLIIELKTIADLKIFTCFEPCYWRKISVNHSNLQWIYFMSEKIVQNAISDYMLTQAFQGTNAITRALAHTCVKALRSVISGLHKSNFLTTHFYYVFA